MKYVVGLGNPGEKYKNTRHNIGFMIVEKAVQIANAKCCSIEETEYLGNEREQVSGKGFKRGCKELLSRIFGSKSVDCSRWRSYQNMSLCEVSRSDEKVCFVKPMTYMNLSGEIFDYLSSEVSPEDILVVVDELYLPLGRMRFRPKGSAGGHNGLISIENSLKTKTFNRLRVGVGRAHTGAEGESGQQEKLEGESIVDFVLGEFPQCESALLNAVIQSAAEGVLVWAGSGIHQVQQQYNGINLRV